MTIDKIKTHKVHIPWKPFGSLHFAADPLGNDHNCAPCIGYAGSVRWPLEVRVLNGSGAAEGGQYVVTYTSNKWNGDWYQSSQPTILNSLHTDNQTMEVCKIPGQLSIAPSMTPTHDPDHTPSPTVTPPGRKLLATDDDAAAGAPEIIQPEGPGLTGWDTTGDSQFSADERRLGESEKISGDDAAISYTDQQLLQCCHGAPGPTYVVACLVGNTLLFDLLWSATCVWECCECR
jgi:hypothetical protein